jgi:hypothetical protein
MGKMKQSEPIWEAKFLLALSDRRSKGVRDIAVIMGMPIVGSTTQMLLDPSAPIRTRRFVEKIAKRLSKRGLIKSTWGSYKITDAGLAWLQGEGKEYAAQVLMGWLQDH